MASSLLDACDALQVGASPSALAATPAPKASGVVAASQTEAVAKVATRSSSAASASAYAGIHPLMIQCATRAPEPVLDVQDEKGPSCVRVVPSAATPLAIETVA